MGSGWFRYNHSLYCKGYDFYNRFYSVCSIPNQTMETVLFFIKSFK